MQSLARRPLSDLERRRLPQTTNPLRDHCTKISYKKLWLKTPAFLDGRKVIALLHFTTGKPSKLAHGRVRRTFVRRYGDIVRERDSCICNPSVGLQT